MAQKVFYYVKFPVSSEAWNEHTGIFLEPSIISGFRVTPGSGRNIVIGHSSGETKSFCVAPSGALVKEETTGGGFATLDVPESTVPHVLIVRVIHSLDTPSASYHLITGQPTSNDLVLARIIPKRAAGTLTVDEIQQTPLGTKIRGFELEKKLWTALGVLKGIAGHTADTNFTITGYTSEDGTLSVAMNDGLAVFGGHVVDGFSPLTIDLCTYPLSSARNVLLYAEYDPNNDAAPPAVVMTDYATYNANGPLVEHQIPLYRLHLPAGSTAPTVEEYITHVAQSGNFADYRYANTILSLNPDGSGFATKAQAYAIARIVGGR